MTRQSRKTRQKELLQKEIGYFSRPFFAEELHKKIIAKTPEIGIATVYRFLKFCKEQDLLHSYTCNGKTIYSKEKLYLLHFKCESCGKEEKLDLKDITFLEKALAGKGKICHLHLEIFGTCKNCIRLLEKRQRAKP